MSRASYSTTYGGGATSGRTAIQTKDATGENVTKYTRVTETGMVLTSYSYGAAPQEESIYNTTANTEANQNAENDKEKELTYRQVLNSLQTEEGLIDALLQDLQDYCAQVGSSHAAQSGVDTQKVFVASRHYSHSEEVAERMAFFKFFAKNCDFHFRQVQLRVIYDSLSVRSPFAEDAATFLKWCKTACQESDANHTILDLNEVGELFSDLIDNNKLDVTNLPVDGFEFLQNYFISVNETAGNLVRIEKKKPAVNNSYYGGNWSAQYNYGYVSVSEEPKQPAAPEEPEFSIRTDPSKLLKLDLVWMVVMMAQNQDVAPRAVKFLISIYMSLSEEIE
jgi:hypothetical protein